MSFSRILRTSAFMGGAQVVVLAAGFVRMKLIAMLFGAAGVGLFGVLSAFSGNVASLAGWGIATSGVRVIAGAQESAKEGQIAAVRHFGRLLGWLGLAIVALAFWPVSRATFGSDEHALELALAGLSAPCLVASGMWSAVLQGTGRVQTLAKLQIGGALGGLLLGLPGIYFLGDLGLALAVFLGAAAQAFVLWRAARKQLAPIMAPVDAADVHRLFRLGGALMAVGWFAQLSAYVIRLVVIREAGLEAAGYYQAAYALAGSLPGFVFAAMAADFFPRIAAASDERAAADIADKQIQAGLLLALPLLAVLLTAGRLLIYVLFDRTFDGSLSLLPWMVWGIFLRLLAWPLGYWLLARGSSRAVILTELVANLLATLLPWLLLPFFGLEGVAIAFFGSYGISTIVLLGVARARSGRWLGGRTVGAFAVAAGVLLLAQVSVVRAPGLYWGLLPSAIIATGCFWAYRRTLHTP